MSRQKTPDITSLLGGKAKEEQAPAPESKQDIQSIPSKQSIPGKPSAQKGLPAGWTRATFIIKEDQVEQLKALAYYRRRPLKEVLEEALTKYVRGEPISKALKLYRGG